METSEALNLAADHIQRYGHSVGRAYGDGPVRTAPSCMIGAVGITTIAEPGALEDAVLDALIDHLPDDASIAGWSDSHSAAEVIEVLRACALIESAREQDSAWQTYATNVARVTV